MDLKRCNGYAKMIICGMRIFFVLVLVSILLSGASSAETACEKFKNVSALNGSINILYNNAGKLVERTSSGDPQTVYEWNIQEYVDRSFRAKYDSFHKQFILNKPITGLLTINDWLKTTHYKNGNYFWDRTVTVEGSQTGGAGPVYIDVNLTRCEYKFLLISNADAIYSDNDPNILAYNLSAFVFLVVKSAFHPISDTILSGSANFPAKVQGFDNMDQYDIYFLTWPASMINDMGADLGFATVTWEFRPSDNETIKIHADPSEIDVRKKNGAKSRIKVTVKKGNEPVKNEEVEIKVCTEPGKIDTDGHIHDKRNDKCEIGSRPLATIKYKDKTKISPFVVSTDDRGEIILNYTPPESVVGGKIITGEDKIIATLKKDTSIKDEKSIKTKLPYDLQQMPFSADCKGGNTYFFAKQKNHGCIFYGTEETNLALVRIANAFWQKQLECKNNPDSKCVIKDDSNPPKNKTVTIQGEPVPMKITAVSLPWGGLLDIGPSSQPEWNKPHSTHQDGTMADIGWGNLDSDRRWLLRYVIANDSNYDHFPSNEGGNMALSIANAHFHIYFKN